MRRAAGIAVVLVAMLSACARTTSPPVETVPPLTDAQLNRAVLTQADVGDDWVKDASPEPTTVQIGGRIGPANVDHRSGEATSTFTQKTGSGSISNSVFLITSVRVARAIMRAHRDAAKRTSWSQDRDDGTKAGFRRLGTVKGLPTLGDDLFSGRMKVTITDPTKDNAKTIRGVDYVVYRTGGVLAFVVTQDVSAATYAARQERRVAAVLGQ